MNTTIAIEEVESGTEVRLEFTSAAGIEYDDVTFEYVKPDGTTDTVATAEVDGVWSVNFIADDIGLYGFTFSATEPDLKESGTFLVEPTAVGRVISATDLRVLVPRMRRALFGPARAAQTALTESEIIDLAADSISRLILLAPDHFGYTLLVAARDPVYGAPSAWETGSELSLAAQTVVATQAVLDYWTHELRTLKVQESIKDEAQEWSWSISAQALRDHLNFLKGERDAALAALAASSPILDQYASFLAVRDATTSRLIEPWVDGVSVGGVGGQAYDPRFY